MLLSIVIVALNEEKRLPVLLRNLQNQLSSRDDVEVILIDNGSKDNTLKIMKDFLRKNNKVRAYNYIGNVSSAYQHALKAAKGEYVVFVDADMSLPQNWLKTIPQLIENKPDFDAFVARLFPFFRYRGSFNDYVAAYFFADTSEDGIWKELTFHSGGLLIKRETALKINFDSGLPRAYDGNFAFRFLTQGYKAYYSPLKYFVFDEQYYELSGLLDYFKNLGISEVLLFKSLKKIKVGKVIIRTLLEPFTPHYLVTKYRKARSATKISYSKWILAGSTRFLTMSVALLVYGVLNKPLPNKVLRNKI